MELNFVVRKSGREFGLTLENNKGDVLLCCGYFCDITQVNHWVTLVKSSASTLSNYFFTNNSGFNYRFKLIILEDLLLGFSVTYANKESMESSVGLIMAFAKEAEVVQS